MTLDMKDGSSTARWRSSWQISTRCSFCSGLRRLGTNFAATWSMFRSHVRIFCTVLYDTLTIVAMSLMVLRWSSLTSRRIACTFLGVELVEGRPDLSSFSSDVLPLLKRACHSKHLTWLMASFLYARHIISKVSAPDLPSFAQNSVCSLLKFHVHAEIANVKTHVVTKHSCCATPIVHTATPLGMLSGDVPCSQAQRSHSRTAIGWRSMELVLKLFDTPLYSCWVFCTPWKKNALYTDHVCLSLNLSRSIND
jgi:hypothetical protein